MNRLTVPDLAAEARTCWVASKPESYTLCGVWPSSVPGEK